MRCDRPADELITAELTYLNIEQSGCTEYRIISMKGRRNPSECSWTHLFGYSVVLVDHDSDTFGIMETSVWWLHCCVFRFQRDGAAVLAQVRSQSSMCRLALVGFCVKIVMTRRKKKGRQVPRDNAPVSLNSVVFSTLVFTSHANSYGPLGYRGHVKRLERDKERA